MLSPYLVKHKVLIFYKTQFGDCVRRRLEASFLQHWPRKSILSSRASSQWCILSRQPSFPEASADIFQTSQGGFCLSTGRCLGVSSTQHRRFSLSERCPFHFSSTVTAEFTGPTLYTHTRAHAHAHAHTVL